MADNRRLSQSEKDEEQIRCALSPLYFVNEYCWIEDQEARKWIPFHLWPKQAETLKVIVENDLVIILKARKLGLTWLCIAYALWDMLFRSGGRELLFSLGDKDAVDLVKRLRGMHRRLPLFLQATVGTDNDHELEFARLDSTAKAFPCTKQAARNYTGSLALIDEADCIAWLKQLIAAVLPGVEAGGKLLLVSASDKGAPSSEFKRIYRGAIAGTNNYAPIFLPWHARPSRDQAWYDVQTVNYDDEHDMRANYPATPEEALSPRSSDKRFRPEWFEEWEKLAVLSNPLTIPGLIIYEMPQPGETYVVPADPAEGNPSSNPSVAAVLNSQWKQVAVLSGQFEPDVFGGYLVELARWYNDATIVPERNNHGHAVILTVRNLGAENLLYVNPFDSRIGRKKYGWLSSPRMKSMAVTLAAQTLRDSRGKILRDRATVNELAAIEASTLKAPPGMLDDRAMAVIIGYAALRWPTSGGIGAVVDVYIEAPDVMVAIDAGGFA